MPYRMTRKNSLYTVRGPSGTHARGTTKKKAEGQIRLLRGIERGGWTPTRKKATK